MAYLDKAALASDANFQLKVKVAIATAAIDVGGETQGQMSATVYAKRQALAIDVLRESARWVERWAWAIVSNVAIDDASSDSDIQFTVNSMWNDLAGVTGLD